MDNISCFNAIGGDLMNLKINNIMNKYSLSQRSKIKDFLISEIDDENLIETIDFVNSDNNQIIKKKKKILVIYFMLGISVLGFFLKVINI